MNTRRTFTAAEIVKLLSSQKLNEDYALDLGNGLIAKQTAMAYKNPEHPSFILERNGKDEGNIADAGAVVLAEISAILWARYGAFIPDNAADDLFTPDELRAKPEDPNLEPDPTGLIPDWARRGRAEAALARRIADETATDADRAALLTPEELKDAEPETTGKTRDDLLTPDNLK